MSTELAKYLAERAKEYGNIYLKPERQQELKRKAGDTNREGTLYKIIRRYA